MQLILRNNLGGVRNGLDQQRPATECPIADVMLNLVDNLRKAFKAADQGRFLPKWWWVKIDLRIAMAQSKPS